MPTVIISQNGGTAPGVRESLTITAQLLLKKGYEVIGITRGGEDLFKDPGQFKEGISYIRITPELVQRQINAGVGFMLGSSTAGRDPNAEQMKNCITNLTGLEPVGWILSGGDGTLDRHEPILKEMGLPFPVICIPKSVDNDLKEVSISLGYLSDAEMLVESAQRLDEQGAEQGRLHIMQVMGRHSPELGLWVAARALTRVTAMMEGGERNIADICILPHVPVDIDAIVTRLGEIFKERSGKILCPRAFIAICEGADTSGKKPDGTPIVGQAAEKLAIQLSERLPSWEPEFEDGPLPPRTNFNPIIRPVIPDHLQSNAPVCEQDRLLAKALAKRAVEELIKASPGVHAIVTNGSIGMMSFTESQVGRHPYANAVALYALARERGVFFGGASDADVLESLGAPSDALLRNREIIIPREADVQEVLRLHRRALGWERAKGDAEHRSGLVAYGALRS